MLHESSRSSHAVPNRHREHAACFDPALIQNGSKENHVFLVDREYFETMPEIGP